MLRATIPDVSERAMNDRMLIATLLIASLTNVACLCVYL
jgi:hypothetical protein